MAMTRSNDYGRLSDITRTAMDAAQGEMQTLLNQEKQLLLQIAALQESRHQRVADTTAARQGAADVKWQVWIDHRRTELNQELARLYVRKDAARARLKRRFGKNQTVQALLKQQRLEQILKQKRQLS